MEPERACRAHSPGCNCTLPWVFSLDKLLEDRDCACFGHHCILEHSRYLRSIFINKYTDPQEWSPNSPTQLASHSPWWHLIHLLRAPRRPGTQSAVTAVDHSRSRSLGFFLCTFYIFGITWIFKVESAVFPLLFVSRGKNNFSTHSCELLFTGWCSELYTF